MPDVSVVIPVYGQWELTSSCLTCLPAFASGASLEVIVVDNGSTDATPTACPALGRTLFGECFSYLRLERNHGFAAACNLGAKTASGRLLFLLNNDVDTAPGALAPLTAALAEDHRLAGVGPLLAFPEGTGVQSGRVQHLGITASAGVNGPEFRHLYELFPAKHPAVRRRRRLRVITAAAMLVRAPLFHGLGGFYEGFKNGMEDVDLCLRAAEKGGCFSVIPESAAAHGANMTPGRFDHEAANERLLRTRRRDPELDLYDLAAEDGYEVRLNAWLQTVVRLRPERERELDKAKARTPSELLLLLEREPLWSGGYARLAEACGASGAHQEALAARHLQSVLCPTLANYKALKQAFAQAGLATKNAGLIAEIEKTLADKAALMRSAARLRRKAPPQFVDAIDEWERRFKAAPGQEPIPPGS